VDWKQKQENNHSFFNREDAKKAGAENQGVAALKIKAKITNKIKAKIFVSILRNEVTTRYKI
jgi:hypothetical protein